MQLRFLFFLCFLDDLLLNVAGSFLVANELAGERSATLSHGAQVDGVGAHLGHGDLSLDGLHAVLSGHAEHGAAALGGDIGHDIAEVRVGDGDLEQADRLKNGGLGLGDTVLICQTCSGLERHIVGVDRVVGAVVQSGLQADQRVTGEDALDDCVAQTLFDGGEEVLGDGAAEDFLGMYTMCGT